MKPIDVPAVIPDVPRFRERFAEDGIDFTFAPFSGVYEGRRYPDAYTAAEREALGMTEADSAVHRTSQSG
ncbi:MAG: hypothetical protein VBE63_01175 [Lamprobacter sp.]|uniref:hypothetical protein n=1 Tax=Lamprobacter sp. TaxID=3100796 RepID=UPI002B257AF4|nr:hypothetical protein [Lamprobacter sp.]MEA3638538.1 hypothetical protein [Lamprobacter sp.]